MPIIPVPPSIVKKSKEETAKDIHKYGYLMAVLPDDLRKEITDYVIQEIPDFQLSEKGRELQPHITINYGFSNMSAYQMDILKTLLLRFKPFEVTLENISLFENIDKTILKIDINSEALHELHEIIKNEFNITDTYETYAPHITLCYLKSAYADVDRPIPLFIGRSCVINVVSYSSEEDKTEMISLGDENIEKGIVGERDQKSINPIYRIKEIIESVVTVEGLKEISEIVDTLSSAEHQELRDLIQNDVTPETRDRASDILKETSIEFKSLEEKKDKRGHRYCVNEQGRTKCPDNGESTSNKKESPQKEKEDKNPKENPEESPQIAERVRKLSTKISEKIDLKQINAEHPVAKQIAEDEDSHEIVKAMIAYHDKYSDLFNESVKAQEETKEAFKFASTYIYFPLAKLDEKKKAIVLDYKEKQQKSNELNAKWQEAEKEVRSNFLMLMKPNKSISVDFIDNPELRTEQSDQYMTDELLQKAKSGLNFVKMICAGDLNTKVGLVRTANNRSCYRVLETETSEGKVDGTVVLSGNARTATTVHELGHFLDNNKKGVREKALSFLKYRTENETSVDMGEIADYLKGEQGKKDQFDRYFGDSVSAYYVGKEYESGDNEIVSMGLQALYENPIKFCASDPEYAQFIIGILRDGDSEKVINPKQISPKPPVIQTKKEQKAIAFNGEKK